MVAGEQSIFLGQAEAQMVRGVARGMDRLQGPAFAGCLVEAVMPVGVGVDEPRMKEALVGVDDPGVFWCSDPRFADLDDAVTRYQDVRGIHTMRYCVEDAAAAAGTATTNCWTRKGMRRI